MLIVVFPAECGPPSVIVDVDVLLPRVSAFVLVLVCDLVLVDAPFTLPPYALSMIADILSPA